MRAVTSRPSGQDVEASQCDAKENRGRRPPWLFRRVGASIAVFVVGLLALPGNASAKDDCPTGDVGPGFFIALPRCLYTIHGEFSVTAGTASPRVHNDRAVARIAGEAGVLFATAGRGSLELGPVLAVAALSDVNTGIFSPEVAPLLRARHWIANDHLTLEGAVGPTMRFFPAETGIGSIVSAGLGIEGVGGIEVLYDNKLWPEQEHRIQAGFRVTWGGLIAAALWAAKK